ncbi:MAG: hypothetical protein H0W68_07330 [Gemmatimonadaceae bacterium]|nr:hypothetical protein [Gemmatimonadaceae bacterium]
MLKEDSSGLRTFSRHTCNCVAEDFVVKHKIHVTVIDQATREAAASVIRFMAIAAARRQASDGRRCTWRTMTVPDCYAEVLANETKSVTAAFLRRTSPLRAA